MSDRHWSYSELTSYMRCPLRHFFEYVLALPRRTEPSALALGSAIHQAFAAYHQAIQQGKPIALDTVKNEFLQAWEQRKREETIVFQRDEKDTIDQGIALVELYLRQPPPENILAGEQELVTPLANSEGEFLSKPLVSVLDLVTRDENGDLKVTDIKTSSKSYSDYEAQFSLQPTIYLYAAQHHFGEPAIFEYEVLLKINKPRLQQIRTARMPTDFDRLGDLVEAIDRAVVAGVHYPVESTFNCSGCPYRKPCRQWQGEQTNPQQRDRVSLPVCGEGNHAA